MPGLPRQRRRAPRPRWVEHHRRSPAHARRPRRRAAARHHPSTVAASVSAGCRRTRRPPIRRRSRSSASGSKATAMHLVCDPRLPKQESDLAAFERRSVRTRRPARSCSTRHDRAALRGLRRPRAVQADVRAGQKTVAMAEPVLRKHRMKLAIENHKGWRAPNRRLLKRLGSEWVGVCLDFGNNLALCEDPMDTARTLAPYRVYGHIKTWRWRSTRTGSCSPRFPWATGSWTEADRPASPQKDRT